MRAPIVTTLLLALVAAPASGQESATSFTELRLLVRPGERVTVVDTTGREATGRISELLPSSITLLVDRQPRAWQEDQVSLIRQRRRDSLGNGALWGLAIGAGLATALVIAEPPNEDDVGWALLAIGVYGAMGTGVGVGVDALITRRQVIYERPATRGTAIGVGTSLTPRRAGAFLSLRF